MSRILFLASQIHPIHPSFELCVYDLCVSLSESPPRAEVAAVAAANNSSTPLQDLYMAMDEDGVFAELMAEEGVYGFN